jgi:ribonucleoside-diphosphate reductase alpha chain
VFDRLAGAWAYWGWKGGYFTTEADARAYYDEMRFMLARQMAAPNSPQWFNTGLHWAYGIDGPSQGHFYVDHQTGELTKSDSAYEHPQPHACFIQSVKDDLVNEGGIMDLWVREARLFKYGSGTGTNFSSLRGEGEKLSGGGKSSGLMGFLKIGDRAAGAIKSGGTTRRAAKMVICDMDHPDIEEFINWKVIEEQKVASLVAGSKMHEARLNDIFAAIRLGRQRRGCGRPGEEPGAEIRDPAAKKAMIPDTYTNRVLQYARQGFDSIEFPTYDTDWDSEAYASVSGQNSNNSVRVTDAFLRAVKRRCRLGADPPHRWQGGQDRLGPRAVGPDRPCRLGLRRSGHPVPRHRERLAHLPGRRPDPRLEPLLGIHVPRRHRLQPGVDEPADLLQGRPVRRRGLCPRHRLWTVTLEISVMMAQFPSPEIAQLSL